KSAVDGRIELSDGSSFQAGTLVWNAGVKAAPVVRRSDLPLDEKGRVKGTEYLTIEGMVRAFTAGDNAAIPDLTQEGEYCPPNAQHAVRQAKLLGDNIVRSLRGKTLKPYVHSNIGAVAGLGLHKGVAQTYGIKVKGWPAWFMHRTYHGAKVPTFNRKLRVVADWTLALFLKRETVSLATVEQPRAAFELAALDDLPPAGREKETESAACPAPRTRPNPTQIDPDPHSTTRRSPQPPGRSVSRDADPTPAPTRAAATTTHRSLQLSADLSRSRGRKHPSTQRTRTRGTAEGYAAFPGPSHGRAGRPRPMSCRGNHPPASLRKGTGLSHGRNPAPTPTPAIASEGRFERSENLIAQRAPWASRSDAAIARRARRRKAPWRLTPRALPIAQRSRALPVEGRRSSA